MPLFYLVQPIYWDYAEVLNLSNSPDYLILADIWEQYKIEEMENIDTKVINPGNFSCSRTFTTIYPHLNKIEESSFNHKEA